MVRRCCDAKARARMTLHFGATARRADARHRNASDVGAHPRSGNEANGRQNVKLFLREP